MGELDDKHFLAACKKRYAAADGEAEIKAEEFCFEWQEHLKDANLASIQDCYQRRND